MNDQLILKFPTLQAYKKEDFYVSPGNQEAYDFINSWPKWIKRIVNIYGPPGSGKSHLASILENKTSCLNINSNQLNEKIFLKFKTKEALIIENLDEKISELELEKTHLINRYQKLASQLNTLRMKFAVKVSSEIEMEMSKLNMAGAKFQVQITQVEDRESFIQFEDKSVKYGSKGYDQVSFFLSANPGELPKPLIKIASGGEVSRIMLAIKSVLKKSDPVETLIFDEIDTGISGQAAEKVGDTLKKLSRDKQVICITHLPQIASIADHHLFIHKKIKNEQTEVVARYLNNKEKIQAIAELFSGENMPKERIKSSQQFIDQARG